MVAPTCFGITLPSSGSVPSAFWEMLNWGAVDRILWMGVLCLVTWCAYINEMHGSRSKIPSKISRSYRVIQEESALLWEMIVWVILNKKSSYEHESDFERLRSYGHFLIPVHALVWTALTELLAAGGLMQCKHYFASWLAHPATDSPVSVSRHLGNKGNVGWVFAWLQADSNVAAGYSSLCVRCTVVYWFNC